MGKNLVSHKVPKEFDDFVKKGIIDKIRAGIENDKINKQEFLKCMVNYFKSNDISYTDLIKTRCKA